MMRKIIKVKGNMICPFCDKRFKPKFRLKYSCICPNCGNKIEIYKNNNTSKFMGMVAIILFMVLTSIVKFVSYICGKNELLIFIITLPIFYFLISPIHNAIVVYLHNKSIKNQDDN